MNLLFLNSAENENSRAVWTADNIIFGHKQVDTFSGNTHKAAATSIVACFFVLRFNNGKPFGVIEGVQAL